MVVAQLCTLTQMYEAVHFKWVIVVVCKMYLKILQKKKKKKDKREHGITRRIERKQERWREVGEV